MVSQLVLVSCQVRRTHNSSSLVLYNVAWSLLTIPCALLWFIFSWSIIGWDAQVWINSLWVLVLQYTSKKIEEVLHACYLHCSGEDRLQEGQMLLSTLISSWSSCICVDMLIDWRSFAWDLSIPQKQPFVRGVFAEEVGNVRKAVTV